MMMIRWAVLVLLCASTAFAQPPDPRDSIILESKAVAPGLSGNPAFTMKVYITNKDTVVGLWLGLAARTVTGNAYAVLGDDGAGNRVFPYVATALKNTLNRHTGVHFSSYNEASPDSFFLAGWSSAEPTYPRAGIEPPNLARSAVWELKFKSTSNGLGEIQFDTARFGSSGQHFSRFTIVQWTPRFQFLDIPVNFVKSVITVRPLKGDMNLDSELRASDLVLLLNYLYLNTPPPVGLDYCDLNCDGEVTFADLGYLLNAVFREEEFPC